MRDIVATKSGRQFLPFNVPVECFKTGGKFTLSVVPGATPEVPPDDEAGRKPDHVRLRRICDVDDAGFRITSDVEIPPGLFRMNVVHDGPWPPLRK
jgi:hypothetical protein